jgi:hypothetical protein
MHQEFRAAGEAAKAHSVRLEDRDQPAADIAGCPDDEY